MGGSVFELDTKGICIMCLRRGDPGGGEGQRNYQSLQSFKLLMRYLNIDVLQKCCNFPPSFLQSFVGECLEKKEIDMGVKLCGVCQDICEEFSDIYMKFEMIRLQLDECVQALYQMMQGGDKDKGRKGEWEKKIFGGGGTGGGQSWNPLQLFHASIADNLRKETLKKCSLRVKTAVPRVTISKSAVPVPETSSPPSTPINPSTGSTTPPSCVITETKGHRQSVEETLSSSLKVETIYSPSPRNLQEDNHQDQLIDNHSPPSNDPLANDDDNPITVNFNSTPPFIQTEGEATPTISWRVNYSQNEPTPASSTAPANAPDYPSEGISTSTSSSPSNRTYCRSCDKSFASKESLKAHFYSVHTFEAFFNQVPLGTTEDQLKFAVNHCVQQYKKFQNPGNIKNRLCSFCGKNFRDVFFLKLHILDNHFDQVLQALKNSPSEFTPKVVAKKRTGGAGGRSTSPVSVSMPRYLTSTGRAGSKLREGYKGPVYSCPICQKVFTVQACMKRHFKTFHTKEGANQFKCPYCEKTFMTGFNKRLHVSSVHVWEMNKEFLRGELGEGVSEERVKVVIKNIVREQEKDKRDNKEKVLCGFCGRWCNDTWYFKMHLVENHFGEVVSKLKGGGMRMGVGEVQLGGDVEEEEENLGMQMQFYYEGEGEQEGDGGEVEALREEEEDDEVMVVGEGRSGVTEGGGGDCSARSLLRKMLEDKRSREVDNSFVERALDLDMDFDGGLDLD